MRNRNSLKNKVIYQVYVRNFTKEGTFKALETKLDYLKNDMKVDVVYLLPISPIGQVNKKGDLGCPYSIQDYTKINEELGTLDDFKSLINETHKRDMKLMIDIVFNHTSRDSWILKNHEDWMYHNKEGKVANKVGEWSDVYDLDYNNEELIPYLINVIDFYSSLGVDGYRFDVGSLLPRKFYQGLRKLFDEKYPDTIMLCEAVEPNFIDNLRSGGFTALSDSELYEDIFDLCYMYNSFSYLRDYLLKKDITQLHYYKVLLKHDYASSQHDALRIRQIENHDQLRLCQFTSSFTLMRNLEAFMTFMVGPMFIYNGLETKADHVSSLFTKDLIDMDNFDDEWFNFIQKLIDYKKDTSNLDIVMTETLLTPNDSLILKNNYLKNGETENTYGVFSLNLDGETVLARHNDLPDGLYVNILNDEKVIVKDHSVLVKEPMYLKRI